MTKNHDKAESESRVLVIESDKRRPTSPALEEKNLLWRAQSPWSAVLFCRGVVFCRGALFKVLRGQKAKAMVVHMCFQSLFNVRSFQIYLILLLSITMFDFSLLTRHWCILKKIPLVKGCKNKSHTKRLCQ